MCNIHMEILGKEYYGSNYPCGQAISIIGESVEDESSRVLRTLGETVPTRYLRPACNNPQPLNPETQNPPPATSSLGI